MNESISKNKADSEPALTDYKCLSDSFGIANEEPPPRAATPFAGEETLITSTPLKGECSTPSYTTVESSFAAFSALVGPLDEGIAMQQARQGKDSQPQKKQKREQSMEPKALSRIEPHASTEAVTEFPTESHVEDIYFSDTDETTVRTVSNLKLQVDALVTGIMLTASNPPQVLTSAMLEGLDPMEVLHRVMTRLKLLRDENKRLFRMVNSSFGAQLEARAQTLAKENAELKREISQLTG